MICRLKVLKCLFTTTADSLQRLKQQHADLQAPLEILWAARLALIGALVALGWTLGSLIVTALADSPIAVPAAAVEIATPQCR